MTVTTPVWSWFYWPPLRKTGLYIFICFLLKPKNSGLLTKNQKSPNKVKSRVSVKLFSTSCWLFWGFICCVWSNFWSYRCFEAQLDSFLCVMVVVWCFSKAIFLLFVVASCETFFPSEVLFCCFCSYSTLVLFWSLHSCLLVILPLLKHFCCF